MSAQQALKSHTCARQANKVSHLPVYSSLLSAHLVGCHVLDSISCGKSPSIFNTKSFTPYRCIVGIWARNFKKTKQFCNNSSESHSKDVSLSWLKQDMQCLRNIGTWASMSQHNSIHLSVDWCVRYQFPIDFDCWFVSVEARIGLLLIVECLFNCQPWLSFWGSSTSFSNRAIHFIHHLQQIFQVDWCVCSQ